MFGHVFQQSGLPRSYRRVAWLQSDGVAYINLEYDPVGSPAQTPAGVRYAAGTQINISAIYPASSLIQPGWMIGMAVTGSDTTLRKFGLSPNYKCASKVADSGTVTFQEENPLYGTITFNASYSRDEFGAYSGTYTMSPDVGGEGTYTIPENGGSIAEHCPAQRDSANPTYKNFSLMFPDAVGSSNYTESSEGIASTMFFSGIQHSLGFSFPQYFDDLAKFGIPTTIESASYAITGGVGGNIEDQYSGTIFLFAKNNDGLVSDIDRNVKVNAVFISEKSYNSTTSNFVFATKRNLVACVRKRDEKPGFYDLRNHRFFTNAAQTGEFLFAELET